MNIKELAKSFNENFCDKKVIVYLKDNEQLKGRFFFNDHYDEVNLTIQSELYRTRISIPIANITNIKLIFEK